MTLYSRVAVGGQELFFAMLHSCYVYLGVDNANALNSLDFLAPKNSIKTGGC
jgi:hypothetical protein